MVSGTVATQRRDEVLSLQTLFTRSLTYAQDLDVRLLVASSKGDPAGRVVACGAIAPYGVTPAGIAANDTDVYVSYGDRSDTVIARVTP